MIYFGCSQWGYSSWKGIIYPQNAKPGKFLYHDSREFNCVEVNPTYHDYVEPERITHWQQEVNEGFKFCPKFPKLISHDKMLYGIKELTDDFVYRAGHFGENLGICFLQLHPDFMPEELPVLDAFLKNLPKDFKISVELKSKFLESTQIRDTAFKLLAENNAGIVILDTRKTFGLINNYKLTNHSAFIRFNSYGIEIDRPRIDNWIKMITAWNQKGLPEIYFFLHFPESGADMDSLFYAKAEFEKLSSLANTNEKP